MGYFNLGSNLQDILNHSKVDYKNTFSNNIMEVYEILGISNFTIID